MAKRKRFGRVRRYYGRAKGRAAKMTIPIAPIAGVLAMPATGYIISSAQNGNWMGVVNSFGYIAGMKEGHFEFDTLKQNMMPLIAGVLVHKAASMIGINRALGQAKIPLLRI